VEAIEAVPDMEVAGIVEIPHNIEKIKTEFPKYEVVEHIGRLSNVDAVVLAVDSAVTRKLAEECMELGINTVDAYDTYSEPFLSYKANLNKKAKETGRVAIICCGWDPGFDGVIRAVMEAKIPVGLTYTNFGPGQSMSHSAAVRKIEGVADAFSLTLPKGAGEHKRVVYVELKEGVDAKKVEMAILASDHFCHGEARVVFVPSVRAIADAGHTVLIERKGVTGIVGNHRCEYKMSLVNTATTSQSMATAVRATFKQRPGAYTVLEIPPIDFIYGDKDQNLTRLIYPDAVGH
jgi:diaminopimelate dehydrogenase